MHKQAFKDSHDAGNIFTSFIASSPGMFPVKRWILVEVKLLNFYPYQYVWSLVLLSWCRVGIQQILNHYQSVAVAKIEWRDETALPRHQLLTACKSGFHGQTAAQWHCWGKESGSGVTARVCIWDDERGGERMLSACVVHATTFCSDAPSHIVFTYR